MIDPISATPSLLAIRPYPYGPCVFGCAAFFCRAYLSVKLDDPSFPAPIYASRVEMDDGHSLMCVLAMAWRALLYWRLIVERRFDAAGTVTGVTAWTFAWLE